MLWLGESFLHRSGGLCMEVAGPSRVSVDDLLCVRPCAGTCGEVERLRRHETGGHGQVTPSHPKPSGCDRGRWVGFGSAGEGWRAEQQAPTCPTPPFLTDLCHPGLGLPQAPALLPSDEHCHVGAPHHRAAGGPAQGLRLCRDTLCGQEVGVWRPRWASGQAHSPSPQPRVTEGPSSGVRSGSASQPF